MNKKKLANGLKRNYNEKITRTLKDMKDRFLEKQEVKKILKKRNLVIYRVFVRELEKNKVAALTVMNPGNIKGEYYMTKGHKHKKSFPEEYILIKGNGKLILQNKKSRVIDLKKVKKYRFSATIGHRLVNVGKRKLEVLTIYDKRAGKNYKINFKKRLLKRKS